LLALTLAPAAWAAPQTWTVDSKHSGVTFEVRHFFSQVPGRFTDVSGKIVYDAENPSASSVEISIGATSINTDNADRDNHLRSPDFFDAEKFPTMTFKSTAVAAKDKNTLSVTGDLTVKGKTKRTTIEVKVLGIMELGGGKAKAGFQADFVIDRQEFGVSWNRTLDQGGTILGDEVSTRISVEADRQ
jgi:polyisoprenoid-binding protein YceI